MCIFRTFLRSADLVNGMTTRLGIDMTARLARDPEGVAQTLKHMVTRCATCTEQNSCRDLQDNHQRLALAPAYCKNGRAFAAMQRPNDI